MYSRQAPTYASICVHPPTWGLRVRLHTQREGPEGEWRAQTQARSGHSRRGPNFWYAMSEFLALRFLGTLASSCAGLHSPVAPRDQLSHFA